MEKIAGGLCSAEDEKWLRDDDPKHFHCKAVLLDKLKNHIKNCYYKFNAEAFKKTLGN